MNCNSPRRGPVKRNKRRSPKQAAAVVSASTDLEKRIKDEDEESFTKKRPLEAEGDMARGDHDDDVDVQRAELLQNKDLEMAAVVELPHQPDVPKITRRICGKKIRSHTGPDQRTKAESKNAVIKERSGNSCRGWCPWRWVFTSLLICMSSLLALRFLPVVQRASEGGGPPPRAVKLELFADELSLLQTQFPSQRPELWGRSRIHLEKHLKTVQPTEPVSLILTAGMGAERTLRCLARGLAASFSSALNASVLYIDGAGTAGKDDDQVKLDIDTQLRAAFEGDQPAAVIHRLEELPPGSTLIFCRYCHHKHAAYKRAFLLFTVLLPQEEVREEQSVKEVEERVQDFLQEKLVDSNRIGGNRFGGLWGHISHLVLPVVWEGDAERRGC